MIHLALAKSHLARHPLPRMLRLAKQVACAQERAKVRADASTKEEAAILLDLAREHERPAEMGQEPDDPYPGVDGGFAGGPA